MHASAYLRRLSRQFSISAPRMAVRTHLGWPWRACIGLVFASLIGGMWWWGFDFGQLFSGLHRHEVDSQLATLSADLAAIQREAAALRSENAQLSSDLAMMRGIQATLQRQQAEAAQENASLKEELSFLQSFFADATKAVGPAIHRLAVTAEAPGVARYSILMVRGVGARASSTATSLLSPMPYPPTRRRRAARRCRSRCRTIARTPPGRSGCASSTINGSRGRCAFPRATPSVR